ncbi:MAG TPA: hypothetical protein VG963_24435 [Polyangiaceae bacterium]|nr:hypothetical protein [Polyangiaceae bacterium]
MIVVEEQGIRHDAVRASDAPGEAHTEASDGEERIVGVRRFWAIRGARRDLALRALLAFAACASVHRVAHASAAALSPAADVATRQGAGQALVRASEPPDCQQGHDAPRGCELKAGQRHDHEADTGLDAPGASPAVTLEPNLPLPNQVLSATCVARTAHFLVPSALPRGPPHTGR